MNIECCCRRLAVGFALAAAGLAPVAPAAAALATLRVEGTLLSETPFASSYAPWSLSDGMHGFRLDLVFDTDWIDLRPGDPTRGSYRGSGPQVMQLSFDGGLPVSTGDASLSITILPELYFGTSDALQSVLLIATFQVPGTSGASSLTLSLRDRDGPASAAGVWALASDGLAGFAAADPAAFEDRSAFLLVRDADFSIMTIDSISLSLAQTDPSASISEPRPLPLLALGMLGVAAWRARRRAPAFRALAAGSLALAAAAQAAPVTSFAYTYVERPST